MVLRTLAKRNQCKVALRIIAQSRKRIGLSEYVCD
jgi:hypothetical protein